MLKNLSDFMSSLLLKLISCLNLNHLLTFILIIGINSCKYNHSGSSGSETDLRNRKRTYIASIRSPKNDQVFVCGDTIEFKLSFRKNIVPDSIRYYADNIYYTTKIKDFEKTSWVSANAKTGRNTVKAVVFYNDSLRENHAVSFTLLSDIIPDVYTYTVINKFPHDNKAFTQGLVYDNGFLYESTGIKGSSSLRKVNIETGVPVVKLDLDPQLFGEGIVIMDDKIYQITYKAQVGFIYDKNTLNMMRRFDYQIFEGWGLTTDGEDIIMSDGSSNLYVIDSEYFTQKDKIEVFNNKGIISNLNELEYINGKIFANVYGDTKIVVIDPETGKVTGELDLKGLMPKGLENSMNTVMNGIAYNYDKNSLYITGKNWPVLYEIEIKGI
jgi:glutamine cyclotransferase